MRTKRTVINLVYAVGSSLLLLLLGLVTRRLLVFNFGPAVTNASQVVDKLFVVFSIAEMGVGSVITYRLYEQIAADNKPQISRYMSMYKWAYRAVGLVIALLAAAGAAVLPWIMPQVDLVTGYTVYGLNVLSTLSSYFLITKRLMYTCTQQGYICTKIDFFFNVLTYLCRIVIALNFPNYVLYFGVTILLNTCTNLVVAQRFKKDFPYVEDVKVSLRDFKELGVFRDLKYYLVHRLSNAVYGTSDTIVTSRLGGSVQTTNLGNYSTLADSATNIGNKIMDSFAAAIGNIVYDKSAGANDHDKQVFWGLDLFSYCFASFVATAYFCLFQPFMTLWMGTERLLPMGFLLMFCLNEYVGWNHRMLGSYRAVLGHFERDWWFMVASAVTNLALSFALYPPFGIAGIVGATVIAHSIMWMGRVRVVFGSYMWGSGGRYARIQLTHLVTLAANLALGQFLCSLPGDDLAGLAVRVVIVLAAPNAVNLACYAWTADAAYLRGYAKKIAAKLRRRGSESR